MTPERGSDSRSVLELHVTELTKSPMRTALARGAIFFALWVVLMPSTKPGDLVVGLLAAVAATWTSLRLLPRVAGHLRFGALLGFVPHFLWESIVAGLDVARRALDPRLPLKPGFVVCPTGIPPGRARSEFASISSLLPGSVPVDDEEGAIVYHCLDTTQPVASQMAAEEQVLSRVLIAGQRHA